MQRIINTINRIENITLVWTILILAFVGFIQVFTRYIFNYSFTWYEEAGRYLGVFIAFSGAAIGVKTGDHFAMDLIVNNIKQPIQGILKGLTNLLCTGFFFTVAWYSLKIVMRKYGYGNTSPVMLMPMYIVYLPIPFYSALIGIRFFFKAVHSIKAGFFK